MLFLFSNYSSNQYHYPHLSRYMCMFLTRVSRISFVNFLDEGCASKFFSSHFFHLNYFEKDYLKHSGVLEKNK